MKNKNMNRTIRVLAVFVSVLSAFVSVIAAIAAVLYRIAFARKQPKVSEKVFGNDEEKPVNPDDEAHERFRQDTLDWLKQFYLTGYDRITPYLAEGKYVVIHDAFMLTAWKDFMQEEKYRRNVILDTHQYLMMAEMFGCEQTVDAYCAFIQKEFAAKVAEMNHYFPVICGEWCLR